jgi:hypothetical protein
MRSCAATADAGDHAPECAGCPAREAPAGVCGPDNGFFREFCGGSALATGVRRVRCADAGRHTGTKRRPGAGFRLMRASGSGRPDPDARIDPPGPFWRRTCGNPAPAPARPGAIAAGNRDLTTKLTHEPIVRPGLRVLCHRRSIARHRRRAVWGGRRGGGAVRPGRPPGWPFHHLTGPFTTSRGTYRDKSHFYSRVLVKGKGNG